MNNKVCKRCGIGKSLDQFGKYVSKKDGHDYWCKECRSAWGKEWKKKNPEKVASHQRKTRYGIPDSEFQQFFAAQSGECAICGFRFSNDCNNIKTSPHVDHSHDTGKVRGLLCSACNLSLGGFKDSVTVLQKAIEYLQKNS